MEVKDGGTVAEEDQRDLQSLILIISEILNVCRVHGIQCSGTMRSSFSKAGDFYYKITSGN